MPAVTRDTIIDSRYRVLGRLGSGGMSEVYCAEDQQLGRKVALKVLAPRFAEDHEFVERFRREASSAAALQHPNIVGIYDRGEWDGTYYIAMEFLDGRSLKDLVRERGPLPPGFAADIVVQVLKALRFAHRRGVVHRDIKPHNVILDEEGRAKVTDFGIARAGASDITETGSIMGTAQYLSPEQAQGQRVDARSDLYAVGVLLYELLTGRPPFEGDSAVSVALKQVAEAPVPPSRLNPAVTPALEAVVLRALRKDPAARFPDADAFIAALELARGPGGPPTGGFVPTAPPAPPPPARSRWPLVLLAVLVLAGAAVAAYALLLRPDQVRVPNVENRTVSTAIARLRARGLEGRVENVQTERVERGRVARQEPGVGASVDEGSTVTLFVSVGPGQSTVPQVVGLPVDRARGEVRDAGFRVRVREAFSGKVPDGQVIRSTPAEGEQADRGRSVTLVVSKGPRPVPVPDVRGATRAAAASRLGAAGLRYRVAEQQARDAAPGTVLATDPAPGTAVTPGSTITLIVATAPPKVEVPDVTGLDAQDASGELSDRGFAVRLRQKDVTNPEDEGVVIDQSPDAGERRSEGARVTLTVGRYAGAATPTPTPTPGTDGAPPEAGTSP
jgi:serine/threonine-protein kinase